MKDKLTIKNYKCFDNLGNCIEGDNQSSPSSIQSVIEKVSSSTESK